MNLILNSEDILRLIKSKYPSAKTMRFDATTGEFILEFDEFPNLTPQKQPVMPEVKKEEVPIDKLEKERKEGLMASGGEARTLMRF